MGLMSQETLGSHELGEPGVSRVTIFPGTRHVTWGFQGFGQRTNGASKNRINGASKTQINGAS